MFTRTFQGDSLREEGHNLVEEPHKMTWTYFFKDRHRETEGRPVVDVSAPFNAMDETHRVRKFGVAKGFFTFNSLNEVVGAKEQVPYTDSHHSFELGCMGTFGVLSWWVNTFMGRAGIGNTVLHNPHLYFATSVLWWMGVLRTTIGASIASFGYFYSYEYLYTHVPGFKIRDPSLNAWRRPWDEGQTTYGARLVASIFPALGFAFCSGRLKRVSGVYFLTAAASLQYEYAREYILAGNRLFYNVLAEKQLNREANWGSLSGDLQRRNDPDTHKTAQVSQFRYVRLTAGMLQDTVWENATHETLPLTGMSLKVNNPYFNWQKAPQNYNAAPIKVKNDLWSMPSVLSAQMRSGVLDARMPLPTKSTTSTQSKVNAASVQRLFQQRKNADANKSAMKLVRREKAFCPGGTGAGDIGGKSLHRSGAHIAGEDDDAQLLNTATQFARYFDGRPEEPENSCFLLKCKKQLHEKFLGQEQKHRIQNNPPTELDAAVDFRKNLYIARHERGLPRRRKVDPYLQLTGAQIDLHSVIPNPVDVDSRHGWMIHNSYRQQLSHGNVPLMTRVMRGEYYHQEDNRKTIRKNFVELNRSHVRAASAASRLLPEPGAAAHCHRNPNHTWGNSWK